MTEDIFKTINEVVDKQNELLKQIIDEVIINATKIKKIEEKLDELSNDK
jgi:hypothetical protein